MAYYISPLRDTEQLRSFDSIQKAGRIPLFFPNAALKQNSNP